MESYSKNDCCGNSLGGCEQLPPLSAGLRAQNTFLKRTMIISELTEDLQDVNVFQVLPVTGIMSVPTPLEKRKEQAKHCDWSSLVQVDTGKQQRQDGTLHLDIGYCMTSQKEPWTSNTVKTGVGK